MSKQPKPVTYNDNDRAIVNALRDSEGMTLAELNEATGLHLVSGNLVSAMKKENNELIHRILLAMKK